MSKNFRINVTRRIQRYVYARHMVWLPRGLIKIGISSDIWFEAPCMLSAEVDMTQRVHVGAFSMFTSKDVCSGVRSYGVSVGRYSSIAADCVLTLSAHPTSWLSTSPVVYQGPCSIWGNVFKQGLPPQKVVEEGWRDTYIGNDVWIGNGVKIKKGVMIGDGAIVGAGAVVTKDIPPYAIACGVPARVMRMRFDRETIERLEHLSWWKYDLGSFGKNVDFSDVDNFLNMAEKKLRNGELQEYDVKRIYPKDLLPYGLKAIFFWEVNKDWVRIKCFGIWLVHYRRRRCRES